VPPWRVAGQLYFFFPLPNGSNVVEILKKIDVKWVRCHFGMARLQVWDGGEGLQIWRSADSMLNK
jgi:hypothetical protein